MDLSCIGARIKQRRKELKLTQTRIFSETGISSGNLSDIENGKKLPSAATLVLLSKILNCSTDWLLTGESHVCDILFADEKEKELLEGYRILSHVDKNELIGLLHIKLEKYDNVKGESKNLAKSSISMTSGMEEGGESWA